VRLLPLAHTQEHPWTVRVRRMELAPNPTTVMRHGDSRFRRSRGQGERGGRREERDGRGKGGAEGGRGRGRDREKEGQREGGRQKLSGQSAREQRRAGRQWPS